MSKDETNLSTMSIKELAGHLRPGQFHKLIAIGLAAVAAVASAGYATRGFVENIELSKTRQSLEQVKSKLETAEETLRTPKTNSVSQLPASHAATVLAGVGAADVFAGPFSDAEDNNIRALISSSKSIKIIAYTSEKFVTKFSSEIRYFFEQTGTKMEVLLADPRDPFYWNNTDMTIPSKTTPTPDQIADYLRNQNQTVNLLSGLARDRGQLEVRYFSNQLRAPIVLCDSGCVLTIRLPPSDTGAETIRLQFENQRGGYYQNCLRHFLRVWEVAAPFQRTP